MIFTFFATKGGVGKSTVATSMAAELSKFGTVLLVDADANQHHSVGFCARRDVDHPELPTITYAAWSAQSDSPLDRYLSDARGEFDSVVVDLGGRDDGVNRSAVAVADRVIVPVPPRLLDTWALDQTIDVIEAARVICPDLEAWAFINMASTAPLARKNTAISRHIRESCPQLTFVDTPLRLYGAFESAPAMGLGILEMPGSDSSLAKAQADFRRFFDAMTAGLISNQREAGNAAAQ